MKKLLIPILMLICIAGSVQADQGWFYNPERSGEGIVITEFGEGRIVFAFFSHVYVMPIIIPIPSPAPEPVCDTKNVRLIGIGKVEGNFAYGKLQYFDPSPEFPLAIDGMLGTNITVGQFSAERIEEGGWVLTLCHNNLICPMSIFYEDHYMISKIVE